MAATPCSGIPLSERDTATDYDQVNDYGLIIDSSEPTGKKLKRISPQNFWAGNKIGTLEIKNLAPGSSITFYVTNSSSVEFSILGLAPDLELINFAGGWRGTESVITASSNGVDVKGYLTISFDTTAGDITIGGFANGIERQLIFIEKPNTANNLILQNNSGSGVQKLFTPSGSNITFTHRGGAVLRFNTGKWIVLSYSN